MSFFPPMCVFHEVSPSIVATTLTFLLSGNSVNERTIRSSTCCLTIADIVFEYWVKPLKPPGYPQRLTFDLNQIYLI